MAALATISVPVLAGTPRFDAREHNQRDRIVQGVRSGELTRPETRRLVAGERRLHRHERRMSKRIYRQKHDPQSR
jgi:hypothetical protein